MGALQKATGVSSFLPFAVFVFVSYFDIRISYLPYRPYRFFRHPRNSAPPPIGPLPQALGPILQIPARESADDGPPDVGAPPGTGSRSPYRPADDAHSKSISPPLASDCTSRLAVVRLTSSASLTAVTMRPNPSARLHRRLLPNRCISGDKTSWGLYPACTMTSLVKGATSAIIGPA